jgi:inorganic pyrophosphatase
MKMIDGGETDTKLITVIDVDPRYADVLTLEDVQPHVLKEIQDFFENYKNLQDKTVEINGFEGIEYAEKEFLETENLYIEYRDMPKDQFIAKMKQDHPEKYK